jgi:hypothetical protein
MSCRDFEGLVIVEDNTHTPTDLLTGDYVGVSEGPTTTVAVSRVVGGTLLPLQFHRSDGGRCSLDSKLLLSRAPVAWRGMIQNARVDRTFPGGRTVQIE